MYRLALFSLVIVTFVTFVTFGCSSGKTAGSAPAGDSGPDSDCGNGSRGGDEACDGNDLAGESCTSAGYDSGTLACNADCTFDLSACVGAGPTCGNEAAEGFEECDGTDLRNATCNTVGFDGGTLACNAGCAYDASGCTGTAPACGDDNAEGLEECDGIDLRQLDCTDFGFFGGALACDTTCRFDRSGCTGGTGAVCGDGVTEGLEDCDGSDTNGIACTDLGYTGGTLACDPSCNYDVAACAGSPAVCGDGTRAGLEECDGTDIGGSTCADLGFTGGTLACDSSCTFDASGCTSPVCGNDVQEPGEGCDGADLGGTTCVDLDLGAGNLACTATCTLDTSGCGAVTCGDGAINQPSEACDGSDLGGVACADVGFQFGQLICAADCTFNTLLCRGSSATCDDGVIEGPEECDGTDLNGETCDSLGWNPGGTLVCDGTTCLFATSGCTGAGPVCGNDAIEAGEECDGTDLDGMTCQDFGFNGGTLNCSPLCSFAFFGCTFIVDPVCGNDVAERFERCDGTDLRGLTCQLLNLGTGDLA
ncbi:MAG: hypothetical protein V3T05_07635, partial [Myxococcota bacterium]